MEQHAFTITISTVEHGSYEEAFREALATAERIDDDTSRELHIVVRSDGGTHLAGPTGVFCEGCESHVIPGVRWPTAANGDDSREWVERCDTCQRYATDEEAADAVDDFYGPHIAKDRGSAKPHGSDREQPYVTITEGRES